MAKIPSVTKILALLRMTDQRELLLLVDERESQVRNGHGVAAEGAGARRAIAVEGKGDCCSVQNEGTGVRLGLRANRSILRRSDRGGFREGATRRDDQNVRDDLELGDARLADDKRKCSSVDCLQRPCPCHARECRRGW